MLLTFSVAFLAFVLPSAASLMAWPATILLTGIVQVTIWFAGLPYSAVFIPVVSVLDYSRLVSLSRSLALGTATDVIQSLLILVTWERQRWCKLFRRLLYLKKKTANQLIGSGIFRFVVFRYTRRPDTTSQLRLLKKASMYLPFSAGT